MAIPIHFNKEKKQVFSYDEETAIKDITLHVVKGSLQGKIYNFSQYSKFTLGRDPKCHIHLENDPKISRFHCILEFAPPNEAMIYDLNSRNGTYWGQIQSNRVTFQRVTEIQLHNGDYIKIGESIFLVKWSESEETKIVTCEKCGGRLAEEFDKNSNKLCPKCQPKPEFIIGKKIGTFEVVRKLGEGNMGVVYLVRIENSQQQFAVKIMRPQRAVNQSMMQRFLQEASCASRVKHPNIVRHYKLGYESGLIYISMEYVDGCDLKTYMDQLQRPLTWEEAQALFLPMLDALEFLHTHSIIHRDIKPANILLENPKGRRIPKLSDFGLAKNLEETGFTGTKTGQLLGTADYMSPEQCMDAKHVDHRADIYSLAATFYYILTMQNIYPPVISLQQRLQQVLEEEPIPITEHNPKVPKPFATMIMRCLRKHPEERFINVQEWKQALAKLLPLQGR